MLKKPSRDRRSLSLGSESTNHFDYDPMVMFSQSSITQGSSSDFEKLIKAGSVNESEINACIEDMSHDDINQGLVTVIQCEHLIGVKLILKHIDELAILEDSMQMLKNIRKNFNQITVMSMQHETHLKTIEDIEKEIKNRMREILQG
jgi:hypothetical protein